jgi:hypothetical protein
MSLGILGASNEQQPTPVRVVQPPSPPPGPYPVRAGYQRPQDTYPYYRWQPPVPFAQAHFGPPPAAGIGAYYQTRYNQPVAGIGAYYQTRYNQQINGLGQACPECSFWNGSACAPCPDGSDLPECEGCEGGRSTAQSSFFERSTFWGPVIVGTVTTIAGAFALAYMMRSRGG